MYGFYFLAIARDGYIIYIILKHISGIRGHEEESADDETEKIDALSGSPVWIMPCKFGGFGFGGFGCTIIQSIRKL